MPTYSSYNALGSTIQASEIDTGAVTAVKLATDAVETVKIKDANVTADKLAAGTLHPKLMYKGSGSYTNTAAADVDDFTFTAGDFAVNDGVMIVFEVDNGSTVADAHTPYIQFTSTEPTSINVNLDAFNNSNRHQCGVLHAYNVRRQTNKLVGWGGTVCGPAFRNQTGTEGAASLTTADWITLAWKIALNDSVPTSGTSYFKWWVYKLAA